MSEADKEVIQYHAHRQIELIKSGKDHLLAIRHGLAGWCMADATPEQLLEIVDKNKRSPFN
jgi:hypothetical protein